MIPPLAGASPAVRGGLAILTVVAATLLHWLDPRPGGGIVLSFSLAAVLAAGLGGFLCGVLATTLGAVVILALPTLHLATANVSPLDFVLFLAIGLGAARLAGAAEPASPEPAADAGRVRIPGTFALQARVLESMAEGVCLTDEAGMIVYTNAAEDAMFGYGPGELQGTPLAARTDAAPQDAERFRETLAEHLQRTGTWAGEWKLRRKDGTPFITSARISVLEIRGTTFWVCVQQDITARKRAEEALVDADRRKDEFLATLAHELRNPLAPIRNAIALLRPAKGTADPTITWARGVIDRQVNHMVRLVDDLLDVSRITRGKISLRISHVELRPILRTAVEASRHIIEGNNHTIDVSIPGEPLFLKADPTRLAQVVTNLLSNAAKYTPRGGQIRLSATPEQDMIVIRVTDNGIGIPPEMLERVFEMFAQVDTALDRAQGGLGIGLTLVKRLVEMHGGRVTAQSGGPEPGSEFTLWLPRDTPTEEALPVPHPVAAPPPPPPAAHRVLVVDDNPDTAATLANLLQRQGHDVHTAPDGPAALQAASHHTPTAILLDIGMPGMNGYEVARQLRELPQSHTALLIAITGWGQEVDRQRARQAGFDHHLVKPIDPDALIRLLGDSPVALSPPGSTAP